MCPGLVFIDSCVYLIWVLLIVFEWSETRALKGIWIANLICRRGSCLLVCARGLSLILARTYTVTCTLKGVQVMPELKHRKWQGCIDRDGEIRQSMGDTGWLRC